MPPPTLPRHREPAPVETGRSAPPRPTSPRWRRRISVLTAVVLTGSVAFGAAKASGAKAQVRPQARSQAPGVLINDVHVHASGVDGTAYLVSYFSTSYQNAPVEDTGLIYVPFGTPPAQGWPVVTYAHGTDGMSPSCAPSADPANDVPDINHLLDQGWEVVATDYQGEENSAIAPGAGYLQPHGVNVPTAHDIIDIVRAARQLPAADASTSYVAWGYSQGGSAVAFVEALANSYAPELTLAGVVSTAPSAQILDNFYGSPTDTASPFTLLYVAAYHATYGAGAVPLPLTATGMSFYNDLSSECYDALANAMSSYQVDQVFNTNTLTFFFAILLASNDPIFTNESGTAPVLLVQGESDTTDTPLDTWALSVHMCDMGQNTLLWDYPGLDHNNIVDSSMGDITHWIADRFAGVGNPDPYAPTGTSGIYTIRCN